jgi:hypothetical protein
MIELNVFTILYHSRKYVYVYIYMHVYNLRAFTVKANILIIRDRARL